MVNWKDVGDTVQSFVTAGGIVVGGVFTYFKFIKDRVYRPRVALDIDAGIIELGDEGRFLLCRASVENKGATKLSLKHSGTALTIRTGQLLPTPMMPTVWTVDDEPACLNVFAKHDWLESTETIFDDVLIRAQPEPDAVYRVELRLDVAAPSPFTRGNITITTARVVPATQAWPMGDVHDLTSK